MKPLSDCRVLPAPLIAFAGSNASLLTDNSAMTVLEREQLK